jgi:hypothetical protein
MAIKRSDKDFPEGDSDLGGPYARDTHRGAYGDNYAREGAAAGTGARGDTYNSTVKPRRKRRKLPEN